ncbi:MAG: prepilin-type N-terminal cleavage/methylation domain-containing protein [Candidatus Omnitrophica bacterium]|nr:prepilin-type N-terminal cleavage/methylation domain-containing protein [Candidatus Omnitrophota bacterium]
MRPCSKSKKGFTLVEIIITIVIWSVLILSVAFMAKEHIIGAQAAADISVAYNLARLEMSKVNSLTYSDATLADGYNNTTTGYEAYRYDLNRTVNYVSGSGNNIKKVAVTVYEPGSSRRLAGLVTYIADVSSGPGSGGGSAGEADSLAVSGGSVSGKNLEDITLINTSLSAITITGVTISFTGQGGIKLQKITMDGTERWEGNESSGGTVTLDTAFTLQANTTYTNTGLFEFKKNLTSVTGLVFIMSDGTETGGYTW